MLNSTKESKTHRFRKHTLMLDLNFSRQTNDLGANRKNELKIDIKSQLPEKNIEKGFDKKRNMHFYKIYFNEELN